MRTLCRHSGARELHTNSLHCCNHSCRKLILHCISFFPCLFERYLLFLMASITTELQAATANSLLSQKHKCICSRNSLVNAEIQHVLNALRKHSNHWTSATSKFKKLRHNLRQEPGIDYNCSDVKHVSHYAETLRLLESFTLFGFVCSLLACNSLAVIQQLVWRSACVTCACVVCCTIDRCMFTGF